LDNTANHSLCESPRKSPKSNGADRAGIKSETAEVVLYFLQQVFHNLILSRRPFVRPARLCGAGHHGREVLPASLSFCFKSFERWEECA